MATGKLYASQQLTSGNLNTYTNCYAVPSNYYAVFNISITNAASTAVTIRIALTTSNSAPVSAGDLIEYGATIQPNGTFERTGIVLNSGNYVLVSSSGTDVRVSVWGIETSTT